MKIKCEYCGSMIEDSLEKCPNCGATNLNVKRTVEHTPKTIEELKEWYEARKLPPYEITRFFIGTDCREPKAFGIFRDGSELVVYKNKTDGSRAVRYRGTDEAYAVNEIYLKLKSEILNQKANNVKNSGRGTGTPRAKSPSELVDRTESKFKTVMGIFAGFLCVGMVGLLKYRIIFAILLFAALVLAVCLITRLLVKLHIKKNGGDAAGFVSAHPNLSKWLYFHWTDCIGLNRTTFILVFLTMFIAGQYFAVYNKPHYYRPESGDAVYVNYRDDWYIYNDEYDDYYSVDYEALPVEIRNYPADYEFDWNGAEWNGSMTEFKDSATYEDNYRNSDSSDWGDSDWGDSDNDYDWDSGSDSWDSGGGDWDSDW